MGYKGVLFFEFGSCGFVRPFLFSICELQRVKEGIEIKVVM